METRELSRRELGSLAVLDDFITTKLQPDVKVKNTDEREEENNYDDNHVSKAQGIQKDCTELD